MGASGPTWGEPPHPDVLARLLRERYEVPASERLDVDPLGRGLRLTWRTSTRQTVFEVTYLRGAAPKEDPWDRVVDALDALAGQYVESGRDHRRLPRGDDVEHLGCFYRVRVESDVPELRRMADRLLSSDSS